MGIKDLYKVINENSPECRAVHHLSEFRGYRFAIDISIFLNKFIKSTSSNVSIRSITDDDHIDPPSYSWMNTFLVFLCILKKHGIKSVCVFDGLNPPIEKLEEQERRRDQTKKSVERLERCKEIYNILYRLFPWNLVYECTCYV